MKISKVPWHRNAVSITTKQFRANIQHWSRFFSCISRIYLSRKEKIISEINTHRIIKLNIVLRWRRQAKPFCHQAFFSLSLLATFRVTNNLFVQSNEPRITLYCVFTFNYIFSVFVSIIWLTQKWVSLKIDVTKHGVR